MLIGLLALCHTAVRRRFSCAVYCFVAGAARIQCAVLCCATTRRGSGCAAVRDVNGCAPLRGGGSGIRLFALRYTTSRRGFLATRHTASWRVRRSLNLIIRRPLNGREILSSGRNAKILNLIAHAADGFAPRRRITAHKFYLAARKFMAPILR